MTFHILPHLISQPISIELTELYFYELEMSDGNFAVWSEL